MVVDVGAVAVVIGGGGAYVAVLGGSGFAVSLTSNALLLRKLLRPPHTNNPAWL